MYLPKVGLPLSPVFVIGLPEICLLLVLDNLTETFNCASAGLYSA